MAVRGVVFALAILSCFQGLLGAPDNRGKEFIVAFMDNYLDSFDLELFVTTSRTSTVSVEVTTPKVSTSKKGVNSKFTVTAGKVHKLKIDPDMRLEGTEFSSKGILVTASDEVVVYGVNKQQASNDAYLGLPTDILGTKYYTVTYYPPYRKGQIMVVGTQDTTSVEITISKFKNAKNVVYNKKTYKPGDTISLTMNKYDTFQLQSTGDLTGTLVSSNKPVAVFSGNMKTNTGSGRTQDHLVEQMTPVDTWGKTFATVPTPDRTTGDYFKFVASESSTTIKYTCAENGKKSSEKSVTLSNAGDFSQVVLKSKHYCYIESNKGIMVVQIVMSQISNAETADPAMLLIPPIEQYAADYTFTTPEYSMTGSYTNYFMFVVSKQEYNGLRHNGNAFSKATYVDIPKTDLVGGYIKISEGSHTVRHTSPISVFGGFLFGKAHIESYGFSVGMRLAGVNTKCVPSTTTVGDGIDNDCDGKIDEELCTTENQKKDDDGDNRVDEDCATPPPIDGLWGSWGSWASCSVSCKVNSMTSGTQTRTRKCDSPAPKYDGKQCDSTGDTLTRTCTPTNYCPIHGNWGSWGSYAACTVTCATGTQTRTRLCNNPSPNHGGNQCAGGGTQSISCTNPKCPTWVPLLKVAHGQSVSPASSVYNLWTGTYTLNEYDSSAMSFSAGTKSYKSSVVDKWSSHDIDLIRVSFYSGGREKAWVVFNAAGSNKNSWFSCSKIVSASFSDLNSRSSHNFCSISGDGGHQRRFYLNTRYGGCNGDVGWFAVVEGSTCGWEQKTSRPYFLYSDASGSELSNNMALADVYVISADMDLCNPNPCKNGGSCTAGSTGYVCRCSGTYKGMACQDRDGVWASWASWGSCTKTCGGGTKSRSRSCSGKAGAGSNCPGSSSSSTSCNTHSCAVHGAWGGWSSWGSCSLTCATGTKQRTRRCDSPAPQHGGNQCPGSGSDNTDCNTQKCPSFFPLFKVAHGQSVSPASGVHNLWTGTYTLNEFDSDAMSFNPGTKSFKSSIVDKWSSHTINLVRVSFYSGGKEKAWVSFNAAGADKNNWFSCSRVHATSFSDLNKASTNNFCSINGDSGHKRRFYLNKEYGGCNGDIGWFAVVEGTACGWEQKTARPYFLYSDASGSELSDNMALADVMVISADVELCSPNPCKNGGTCSDGGTRYTCACKSNWKGMACQDLDGGWGSWAAWGSCSVTCAGGTKTRKRACNNPAPVADGKYCPGSKSDSKSCNTHHCPIDGKWAGWAAWGTCTVTCGGGTKQRSRTCTNPSPQYLGKNCVGSSSSSTTCNTHHCPIDGEWTLWASWSSCTLTCKDYGTSQTGTRYRQRACTNPAPQYSGKDCVGMDAQLSVCTTNTYCKIHGGWTDWTVWTDCSVTCASGTKTRQRSCSNPTTRFGGTPCAGSTDDSAVCTLSPCPIDGKWTSWTSWGACTVSCGGGTTTRTRSCTNPAPRYNGANCVGPTSGTKDCNTQVCIIDGDWSNWQAWSPCTVTCGGGNRDRMRTCTNPIPKNGGLPCSGDTNQIETCSSNSCPAPIAGVYQQRCPSGWFTCNSGAMKCIQQAFVCDCDNDCEDGSDEDVSYAQCDAALVRFCQNGANALYPMRFFGAVIAFLTSLLIAFM